MSKIFITGATGFVGTSLMNRLVALNHEVNILVRNKRSFKKNHQSNIKVKVYEMDLLDKKLGSLIKTIRPEYVFHCAAYGTLPVQDDSRKIIDVNIKGILNLIEALKNVPFKLLVNTGSSSEYGVKNEAMKEKESCNPVNLYGVTKVAATLLCQQIAKTNNLPIITLRIFSPYGYFDYKNRLIPSVILNSIKNLDISLSEKKFVRDFIFIEDIVSAYILAMKIKFIPGQIINIGSGKQHSIYEVVNLILKLTKSSSKALWGKKTKQSRQVEPKIWKADIKLAKKILNWEPKYTLKQGLTRTIEWFKVHEKYYE